MESVGPDHGVWGMDLVKRRLSQDTELPFQGIIADIFFFLSPLFFFRFAKMMYAHLKAKKAVHHFLVATDTQGTSVKVFRTALTLSACFHPLLIF